MKKHGIGGERMNANKKLNLLVAGIAIAKLAKLVYYEQYTIKDFVYWTKTGLEQKKSLIDSVKFGYENTKDFRKKSKKRRYEYLKFHEQ
jgi:hypothetical protein